MKIAYVAEWDVSNTSGVLTKLSSQVKMWREVGHDAHLFIISPFENREIDSDVIHIISNQFCKFIKKSFIRTFLNKILSVTLLKKQIESFKPDIIYYRQGIWYPSLTNVLNLAPCIMELNTDDISEIKLSNWLKQNIYLYGRKKIIKKCKGFVAVSYEIENLYKSYKKPITVIGNGIDFDDYPLQKDILSNKRIQFVFVGSPNQAWHGVDKIIKLANILKECDFHIIGTSNKETTNNIIYHGYLNKEQLKGIYKKMDIGLGTLALHRNNMTEASPLKVREYLAYGLAVILGFKDTDLEGSYFVLNIGNYENNALEYVNDILQFAQKWKDNRVIRQDIEKLLGMKEKEIKRLDFFKFIFDEN
jgi:glycosyltransferase involved in cell wall biosynthesis